MDIIAVENDRSKLSDLSENIMNASPGCKLCGFTDAILAIDYAREHNIDVLITELMLTGKTGFGLANELRRTQPSLYVVVISDSKSYALDAFDADINGYIIRPVSADKLRRQFVQAARINGIYA